MRAFLSSPYASHVISPEAGIRDALRLALALDRHGVAPLVLHWGRIAKGAAGVWSPLLQGDIIAEDFSAASGYRWGEVAALEWCLDVLRYGGFDTLIRAHSIPTKPGYGPNGCDREEALARKLGYAVVDDRDLIHAAAMSGT